MSRCDIGLLLSISKHAPPDFRIARGVAILSFGTVSAAPIWRHSSERATILHVLVLTGPRGCALPRRTRRVRVGAPRTCVPLSTQATQGPRSPLDSVKSVPSFNSADRRGCLCARKSNLQDSVETPMPKYDVTKLNAARCHHQPKTSIPSPSAHEEPPSIIDGTWTMPAVKRVGAA
jgi:hypothetical protein